MRLYLDSSALAKRYVEEPGTKEVVAACTAATEILLSAAALPELVSMLCRLKREAKLTEAAYQSLKEQLAANLEDATVMDVGNEVLAEAVACLERHPLKALDAIHVASARRFPCDLFLTSDRSQYQAARALGLKSRLVGATAG